MSKPGPVVLTHLAHVPAFVPPKARLPNSTRPADCEGLPELDGAVAACNELPRRNPVAVLDAQDAVVSVVNVSVLCLIRLAVDPQCADDIVRLGGMDVGRESALANPDLPTKSLALVLEPRHGDPTVEEARDIFRGAKQRAGIASFSKPGFASAALSRSQSSVGMCHQKAAKVPG